MKIRLNTFRLGLVSAALGLLTCGAQAQPTYDGWLCCSLRSDGDWISDINYMANGKRLIPAGTPARVTGYARYVVNVDLDGKRQRLGNDYSRDLTTDEFAQRYVVRENPAAKMASWGDATRRAITSGRVQKGMTREQVIMALGYPVSSENPHLDVAEWRYWLGSFSEYRVRFGPDGRLRDVTGDEETLRRIVMP